MNWFPFSLAAGVFVGNFLFHVVQGNPGKGAGIGIIAAVLVLAFYALWHGVTPD